MSIPTQAKCKAVLRAVEFEWNEYQGVKRPQLVGKFEMIDGPDKGRTETWFASLSEDKNSKGIAFVDFTLDALRACGWKGDDITELPELAAKGALTNEVTITREFRTGKDGKARSSVKYVSGPKAKATGSNNAMSGSDLVELAKRMKARTTKGPIDDDTPF